jgi:hypothetical protein
MYFDYLLDESYTPSKVAIYAGTGLFDLTEVKTIDLQQPRGWQTVNVGDFGRKYLPFQSYVDGLAALSKPSSYKSPSLQIIRMERIHIYVESRFLLLEQKIQALEKVH